MKLEVSADQGLDQKGDGKGKNETSLKTTNGSSFVWFDRRKNDEIEGSL